MYQALYRKYRPTNFSDVVGQKVIIKTLSNSILNNKITHAYLFTGPRGTGKTSIAKILAKIVNCEELNGIMPCNKCVNCTQINNRQYTDIIEIDAASNNGVDEIREIRDKVNLVPSYGKYKVYIIDEVHMLTTAAFNALLKTLEEPPKHIIFILATTEPHKIPQTILSRCQRYDFKKISVKEITKRLSQICELEKIKIEDNALNLIATLSDGGMRDSISLLDQLTAYTNEVITVNDVHDVFGTITFDQIIEFLKKISNKNLNEIFTLIDNYDSEGKNLSKIIELIIEHLKNILLYMNAPDYFEKEEQKKYEELTTLIPEDKIYKMIDILLDTLKSSKTTNNIKLLFELSIIKIIELDMKKEIVSHTEEKDIVPILDTKKEIKIEKKVDKIEVSEDIKEKIENLKKIRINNTLAFFDKKELMTLKKSLDDIKVMLMNPDYSSITSLILDGELKAKGKNNMIFMYKIKNLDECFNTSLVDIEKIFKEVFNEEYKPIAVSESEWEIIKNEFNKNKKENKNVYNYIEEKIDLNNLYTTNISKENINEDKTNEIEEMFEDMIVYN